MKKNLRITIMDRKGVTEHFKPYTYMVNKKFCENWDIQFEGQTKEELKVALENKCKLYGVKLISIE